MKTPDNRVEEKMLSYRGDPELKAALVTEAVKHRLADRLAQGHGYWRNGKGCAVGCTLISANSLLGLDVNPDQHEAYDLIFGPGSGALARLEDLIFERLPKPRAQTWPEEFLQAIPVGADLSAIQWTFPHWILKEFLPPYAGSSSAVVARCAAAIEPLTRGEKPDREECHAAMREARAAWAEAALESEWAAAAAAETAWAAAEAAGAAYAAEAAAETADWAALAVAVADRSGAYSAMADKLLELLRQA